MGSNISRHESDDRESKGRVTPAELLLAVWITAVILGLPLVLWVGWLYVSSGLVVRDWETAEQTIDRFRAISIALEEYAIEHSHYPMAVRNWEELQELLVPRYVEGLPENDAWGTPFEAHTSDDGRSYEIVSLGKDRRPGDRSRGDSDDFDRDIMMRTGWFYQWPRDPTSWP